MEGARIVPTTAYYGFYFVKQGLQDCWLMSQEIESAHPCSERPLWQVQQSHLIVLSVD